MKKHPENLHPIVQFEVLSKCLGNLRAGPQEPEAQPAEYRKLLSRITDHMNCLLDEMEPEDSTPPETSFKDACSIVAKRIHTIMQARDLGEVNITFKPGKGDDWVAATTVLDVMVQSRFSGRDKKKTRQYATLPFSTISEALMTLEAQLMLDDPNVPDYHEQVMRAKPSEPARLVKEYVPSSKPLTRKEQIQLLTTDVSAWNEWYGNLMDSPKLRKVDLRGHNLRGAILYKADLQGADLRETNLHGADLREANLLEAVYNVITIFPEGFDPCSAGMIPELFIRDDPRG